MKTLKVSNNLTDDPTFKFIQKGHALFNLEIIKLVEIQTFMIRIWINKLYDCTIRMIAWTMTTWRRSHDACLLLCIFYYGSNLYRHHASALKFRVCTLCYMYVTAALIECMEVLYIQNMKVLLFNQVYSTKIFIFPAGGESLA